MHIDLELDSYSLQIKMLSEPNKTSFPQQQKFQKIYFLPFIRESSGDEMNITRAPSLGYGHPHFYRCKYE